MSAPTRFWSPSHGLGRLAWMQPPNMSACTFTADNGAVIRWSWMQCRVGKPGKAPKRKADLAEWQRWETFTTAHGEVITMRRDGPPVEAAK